MNLLKYFFPFWGPFEDERGWTAQYPLLSFGSVDGRQFLNGLACPQGHRLDIHRAGSTEGLCPNPKAHTPSLPSAQCVVDAYTVRCATCKEMPRTLFIDAQHPEHPPQRPPKGLQKAAAPKASARTITLDYDDSRPAWRLKTVQPSRFRDVRYQVQTRLFLLPEGALIGILFNLYDIPNQPYFIHRIMDLSDPEVDHYIDACIRYGRIATVFESKGEEPGFRRDIKIDASIWGDCLEEGRAHNASIKADGDRALEIFLDIFHRISRERGVEPAWDEIARRCIPRRK